MLALGCGHASRAPAGRRPPSNSPSSRASGSDASATAAQLSEETRAQLAFPAPGETRATLGERDLDRLLRDEPNAQKRTALAQAEAKVAQTLAPLAIARDAAVDKAIAALGLQSWAAVQERAHGIPL